MSRLLHAAARGARIQVRWYDSLQWQTSGQLVLVDTMREYRIHPNDEHLQYGPVSTALREIAEMGAEPDTLSGLMAMGAYVYECEYRFVLAAEWPHAQMFALILAEALADSGL